MSNSNVHPKENQIELVVINDGSLFTSSIAIAEGVDLQHKNVIALVRRYEKDLQEFGRVAFQTRPLETAGGKQSIEVAALNEDQATLLITYMKNTEIVRNFKKRLVRAFSEIKKNPFNVPETYSAALMLAAQQAEEIEKIKCEVVELKPKAAFHDRVVISQDCISIAKAAKTLGTGRNRLMTDLRRIKWVSKRNEPYQDKIEQGLMDVKLGRFDHPQHGLTQSITPLITGKGLAKLSEMIGGAQ